MRVSIWSPRPLSPAQWTALFARFGRGNVSIYSGEKWRFANTTQDEGDAAIAELVSIERFEARKALTDAGCRVYELLTPDEKLARKEAFDRLGSALHEIGEGL